MLRIAPTVGEEFSFGAEEVLQRVRAGDLRVERLIYDRFQDLVNRLVWRVLGADQEHDDIVQNVFFAVFRGLRNATELRNLEAWIRGVTYKTMLSELRRRKLRWPWSRREPELPDLPDDSVSSYETLELLGRVYTALKKLRSRQHLAYSLSKLEGCSLAEVAVACQCSLPTVKRELRKAEQHFRRLAERDPALAEYLRNVELRGGDHGPT